MALDIKVSESDGKALIEVAGDVDLYTSPDLRAAVLKAMKSAKSLGMNLNGVTYMDSSGVATLVEGLQSASKAGGSFALVTPSNSVMKVLQLARLDTVFNICDTW